MQKQIVAWQPANDKEHEQVKLIADQLWRMRRIREMGKNCPERGLQPASLPRAHAKHGRKRRRLTATMPFRRHNSAYRSA